MFLHQLKSRTKEQRVMLVKKKMKFLICISQILMKTLKYHLLMAHMVLVHSQAETGRTTTVEEVHVSNEVPNASETISSKKIHNFLKVHSFNYKKLHRSHQFQ